MSDHLHSLGASDSGFLNNAFVDPLGHGAPQRGVPSRVGSELTPDADSIESCDLSLALRKAPLPVGFQQRLKNLIDTL